MADIDGMLIVEELGDRACGGAFTLNGASPVSELVKLEGGWTVEVRSGSRVAVARGGTAAGYEDARKQALLRANHGLDLLSMRGIADLQIVRASDEHVTWWAGEDGIVLRVTSTATPTVSITARATVTDALGNVKPDPALPHLAWHESFRYFRLAQVTDDLFEAFRNLYLALESILSTIAPIKRGEREAKWSDRAIRQADALTSLDAFASQGAADAPRDVSEELRKARNAVFHAKASRDHFAPHDWSDRTCVLGRLKWMGRLYLTLVNAVLEFSRPSGGMTAAGVSRAFEDWTERLVIQVTDDTTPFDPAHTAVNPGGGKVVSLPTRPAPELDQPFLRSFIGRAPAAQLSMLTHVSRIASTFQDKALSAGILEGRLTLAGVDHFEAQMGIRIRNRQQPRDFYAT